MTKSVPTGGVPSSLQPKTLKPSEEKRKKSNDKRESQTHPPPTLPCSQCHQLFHVRIDLLSHCHHRHLLASEHYDCHPLSLFPFSPLVAEMSVKAQLTPEDSCTGITEECEWWMQLGESGPLGSMLQILFMMTVELENLRWSYDRKTDLQ